MDKLFVNTILFDCVNAGIDESNNMTHNAVFVTAKGEQFPFGTKVIEAVSYTLTDQNELNYFNYRVGKGTKFALVSGEDLGPLWIVGVNASNFIIEVDIRRFNFTYKKEYNVDSCSSDKLNKVCSYSKEDKAGNSLRSINNALEDMENILIKEVSKQTEAMKLEEDLEQISLYRERIKELNLMLGEVVKGMDKFKS